MANTILTKVNFNNAAVKINQPSRLPTISSRFEAITNNFLITIYPNLVNQDYLHIVIKVDGEEYSIENLRDNTDIVLHSPSGEKKLIELSGYYRISYYNQDIGNIKAMLNTLMTCAETTICGENALITESPQ